MRMFMHAWDVWCGMDRSIMRVCGQEMERERLRVRAQSVDQKGRSGK